MLKDSLSGKTLAIIGYQTLSSRILLKKLIEVVDTRLIVIQIGKQNKRRAQFISDLYFSGQQQDYLQKKVDYVEINMLKDFMVSQNKEKIDILVSLYEPYDFQNKDKIVECHLLVTSAIVIALSQIKLQHCILLSSIYLKESGYVSEEDELEGESISQKFTSREEADKYLADNFDSQNESWRWSINYIERSYLSICKSIVVVRVPSLGPTLCNNEGFTMKLKKIASLIQKIGTNNIQNIYGVKKNKVDIVPNDYVSHLILILMCKGSKSRAETINLSTSTRNYISLEDFIENCRQAWSQYGYKTNKVRIVQSKWAQNMIVKARKAPSSLKKRLGSLLQVASWKIQGESARRDLERKLALTHKYRYFLEQQWLCQCMKTIDLFNQLKNKDQYQYNFNVNNINWKSYVKLCVYAIIKHLMNLHAEQFNPQAVDLLDKAKSQSYFSDVMWALRQGKNITGQRRNDAIQFVLNSKSVKGTIKAMVEQSMLKIENTPTSFQKAEEQLTKVAQQMCFQMFSDYSMNSIRVFAWFLTKLFRSIYERVVIDKDAIAKIKGHDQNEGPLIIIPTHRSYIDFLIMSYVFFGNGIKCPHIAAAEDFLNMAVVHILLRQSGAFFIKRNQKKYKQLYKAIMTEYLTKLMISNHYMQFFVEGTRSRTGKMLAPKFGILSVVASNVLQGKLKNAFILPVTVNYQKILEGNSFTYEMMGQAKVKQSLSRVLKAVDVFKQNYGRIYLEFCDLISIKGWLAKTEGTFSDKVAKLGDKIVRDLSKKSVIAGPAIVASVVLMNRKGISDDSLQEQSSWLAKQISSRGYKITRSEADSSISVNNNLALLEGFLDKSQKDMFQVQVNFQQTNFVKLFTLTYYRNTLAHIFFTEAIIVTSLSSFGYKTVTTKTVTIDQLFEQSLFLWKLLKNEFYGLQQLSQRQKFDQFLKVLVNKGVIKLDEEFVMALNLSSNYFNFYWSLVWPVAESYWVTCLYFFKLLKNKISMSNPKLLTEIQWFGQSLINQRICNYLESISSDTIKNAVSVFTSMKIIVATKQEYNGEQVSFIKIGVEEQQLRNLLTKLQVFLKSSYAKSLKGILQSTQGSVNLDFPFLSRL